MKNQPVDPHQQVADIVVLRALGGCLIITIPKHILQHVGFKERDRLLLSAVDGRITVTKPS